MSAFIVARQVVDRDPQSRLDLKPRAIWCFFGVSMVIGAIRGDAGCEALTIPNAIFGRRERTGCVAFALIDSREAR